MAGTVDFLTIGFHVRIIALMDECLFCKIVRGELSSHKIYEDDHVLAFLDIFPVRKGHTLVIPKIHVRTLTEADPAIVMQVGSTLPHLARAVMKGVHAEGLNLGVNCEIVGGQHIFHLHFHLIPRHTDDGLRTWPTEKYQDGELEQYAKKIQSALASL